MNGNFTASKISYSKTIGNRVFSNTADFLDYLYTSKITVLVSSSTFNTDGNGVFVSSSLKTDRHVILNVTVESSINRFIQIGHNTSGYFIFRVLDSSGNPAKNTSFTATFYYAYFE